MEKEVSIWYDRNGRIIAWGHLVPKAPVALNAVPLVGPGHEALTVKLSEQHLAELHETHYVDCDAKRVVKKKSVE
jgi:hypothetical protein